MILFGNKRHIHRHTNILFDDGMPLNPIHLARSIQLFGFIGTPSCFKATSVETKEAIVADSLDDEIDRFWVDRVRYTTNTLACPNRTEDTPHHTRTSIQIHPKEMCAPIDMATKATDHKP